MATAAIWRKTVQLVQDVGIVMYVPLYKLAGKRQPAGSDV